MIAWNPLKNAPFLLRESRDAPSPCPMENRHDQGEI
jgi:hypothetical protein